MIKKAKVEKQSLVIEDESDGVRSLVQAKISDKKRTYKIVSDKGFTSPGEVRSKVTIHGDNESVTIKGCDGSKTTMSFGELCSLQELLSHMDDLPDSNIFGKTKVVKAKKAKKKVKNKTKG